MSHQTTIQFYRGAEAGIPTLADGEPGWCTDTYALYVGQSGTNRLVSGTTYTDEMARDAVAAMIQNGTGITWSYDDGLNTLTPTVTITQYTDELAQDAVGGILQNTTSITWTYSDATPSIEANVVFGTGSGQACEGNDSRLSDARTPVGTALADSRIWVGTSGGVAAAVAVTGDVTITNAGVTAIGTDKVTYAKMQNVSAASKLLGRGSAAGAGDPEEITLGTGLSMSGTTLSSTGGVPTTITVADTTDSTCYVGLFESATGDLEPKTDAGLTYNASTGVLTATGFAGPLTGNVTGNASTVTVADAGADTTTWVLLGTSQTGSLAPATDAGLTYNANTNALTATTFIGALTGNASTATALATARTINGTSFDGTSNITVTADAGTLTGTTLNATVVTTSITSTGTLTGGATGAGFTVALDTSTFTGTLALANGGTNADLSATGPGFLKQATAGANVSVSTLASTDLPQRHDLLANGGAWFWQRQTPGTLTAYADDAYFADRWYVLTQTASIQCNRTTGNASPYALDLKQTQGAAQRMGCAQIVEYADTFPFRSRTVRLQFSAKCSTTTTVRYAILEWTGTADVVTSDVVNNWASTTYTASNFFIASITAATTTTSVTTSWTSCSLSTTLSATANNLIVFIWTDGTAAQNVTMELSDLILCDANLSRDWLPEPLPLEFARCRRFYTKSYAVDSPPGTVTSDGSEVVFGVASANRPFITGIFPVEMRAAPTVTAYSPATGASGKCRNASAASDATATSYYTGTNRATWYYAGTPSAGDQVDMHWTASAEL